MATVVPLLPRQHLAPFIRALFDVPLPAADGVLLAGLLASRIETDTTRLP